MTRRGPREGSIYQRASDGRRAVDVQLGAGSMRRWPRRWAGRRHRSGTMSALLGARAYSPTVPVGVGRAAA
jgi:hypothetical protein